MSTHRRGPAIAGLVACLALVASMNAWAGGDNIAPGQTYPTSKTQTVDCNDDGSHSITYAGPSVLWPPNHKYHTATITATGHDSDDVTVSSTGTHDEMIGETGELNGAGNTQDDVSPNPATGSGEGSATTTQSVRSERSGRGDGRTYTFDVTATFSDDPTNPCMATFTATVPHDMRKSNRLL